MLPRTGCAAGCGLRTKAGHAGHRLAPRIPIQPFEQVVAELLQAADLLDIRLSTYIASTILRESMAAVADARAVAP